MTALRPKSTTELVDATPLYSTSSGGARLRVCVCVSVLRTLLRDIYADVINLLILAASAHTVTHHKNNIEIFVNFYYRHGWWFNKVQIYNDFQRYKASRTWVHMWTVFQITFVFEDHYQSARLLAIRDSRANFTRTWLIQGNSRLWCERYPPVAALTGHPAGPLAYVMPDLCSFDFLRTQ